MVVSFVIFSSMFILAWLGWVYLSNKKNRGKLENFGLLASVAFTMIIFVIAVFDLSNDLLAFLFEIDVLLPFLGPQLLMIPILLACMLAIGVLYPKYLKKSVIFLHEATHFSKLICSERKNDTRSTEKNQLKLGEEKGAKSYAQISGILAGFCITFIIFLLSSNTLNQEILRNQLVLIVFTIAGFLFIVSAERYSMSITYNDSLKYDRACNLYDAAITSMLMGLALVFFTFELFFAFAVAFAVVILEIILVVKSWKSSY